MSHFQSPVATESDMRALHAQASRRALVKFAEHRASDVLDRSLNDDDIYEVEVCTKTIIRQIAAGSVEAQDIRHYGARLPLGRVCLKGMTLRYSGLLA